MKRSTNAIAAAVATLALVAGLAWAPCAPALAKEQGESARTVACWGDSMTHGNGSGMALVHSKGKTYDASNKSYPQILGDLCGLATYNYGIPGGTSVDIMALQRGEVADFGDEEFNAVAEKIAQDSVVHPGDILILEIGSNGGWSNDYDELISQYRSMIDYADCEDYLVVGDTDDPGTSIGDRDQEPLSQGKGPGETAWEAALRKEFDKRFINMRVYLIEHGLEACGMKPDSQDEACASYGIVPHRLRADWTHLNSYGYYAQAFGIYERGVELGYWG